VVVVVVVAGGTKHARLYLHMQDHPYFRQGDAHEYHIFFSRQSCASSFEAK